MRDALLRLVAAAESTADADQLVPGWELLQYLEELEQDSKLYREALLARLRMLESLGLAQPVRTKREIPVWSATDELKRSDPVVSQLLLNADGIQALLDEHFFTGLLSAGGRRRAPPSSERRILLWFARAFDVLQRPVGFTPGRPVALLACLLAAREGAAVEMSDTYACVYAAGRSRWAELVQFSGGSRFDSEFLIRLEPTLQDRLLKDPDLDRPLPAEDGLV